MKKKISFLLITFSISINCVLAQDTLKHSGVTIGDGLKMKISGFLRSDIFYDTHRNIEKVDGLFNLMPMNAAYDLNGMDNNQVGTYRMTAAASRINTTFSGPEILKANSMAFIEFDFTGVNGVGLSLRHAYLKLSWTKHEVLFGRYFHPMFVTDVAPSVLGINTGAPFLIYLRNEQIRYTWKPGMISMMVAASALMNYGFPSDGYGGYQHYQPVPDLTGNIQLKNGFFTAGVSGNYKVNQPKLSILKSGKSFKTSMNTKSLTMMAYAQWKTSKFAAKGGVIYGQSNNELNMLGGYAVKSRDTVNMRESYTTINNINYWCNLLVGNKLQAGIFAGYSKNLGTFEKQIVEIPKDAARGFDASGNGVDHLIRIAPIVNFRAGAMVLSAELEYSVAAYGKYDLGNYAKVNGTKDVSNLRSMFTATYYF